MQRFMSRPGNDVIKSYETYSKMLFRIALVHLGSRQDAEHQKAWLIRVLTNTCKTSLGRGWRKREMNWRVLSRLQQTAPRIWQCYSWCWPARKV